ncbi:CALCINEURIN-BINDING PROTEIN CABIN 1-RELATED [Salix koriyanagi]|uniref:CALCINEURIN-BINDING PROTEIN CABIN 1-RELATED n=1 Tax=Salix koriyanagi TaxID=2511006 RepID=A0A9Q0W121_9ROSI|nr:CALCINEURIN-BINDING PROTEIN CABIN 1-RELATED [Salix koriyanagi]
MFSIAAINDTDSKEQWEPLAPTKEAQEFHLTQNYHDGLLKLQAKEYDKACELLESVLKDPLISNAQADSNASDGHLLQLRFLVLKNLATVFLQQGSSHYESALRCYLQAVEIDTKDSVVWNQLGTLSCSMGLLSISRWAFEQGLLCSPNNWNCMEKLLEVLIAIGDEVTCLSVAELILRHWPSHSRALHVKNTIEELEAVPFSPRGIDKLEPKHVRLKFLDKRKATDENIDEGIACKRANQNIELVLPEVSWAALTDAILEILLKLKGFSSEMGDDTMCRSGDIRLTISMPSNMEIVMESVEKKGSNCIHTIQSMSFGDCNTKRASIVKERDPNIIDEQPHERRSTRLRSRKPGKELDFDTGKDLAKVVVQLIEPFIVKNGDSDLVGSCSVPCFDQANSLDIEHNDVAAFVRETSKNYGAYHIGHLLLEHAASTGLKYQDAFVKFLEVERLTRHWGKDRTSECCLFLAELYYDLGSLPSNVSKMSEYMSEASYHLCKIIESVALDYPFHLTHVSGNINFASDKSFQDSDETLKEGTRGWDSLLNSSLLDNKSSFWVRYFWLSGKLSIMDGNKAKAHGEFCISMSVLENKEVLNSAPSVCLPHLKINKELTVDRILHGINLLKLDLLLEKTVGEMIEKEMYLDCIDLLAPLLFSSKHVLLDVLPLPADKKGEEFTCIELSALDTLIEACEKAKPMEIVVCLKSRQRKLEILLILAGMDGYVTFHQNSELKAYYASDTVSKENQEKHWNDLVMDEVKAISQCISQFKNFLGPSVDSNGKIIPFGSIGDIQSLLLAVMCHVANYLSKKSSVPVISEDLEQKQICCFVDACIAYCKLQHLVHTIPVKTQVELIVAIHDLLAEYGLCCAGGDGEGEEGTFLKFAIKHLLALDMKLKSNLNSSKIEAIQHDDQLHSMNKTFKTETILNTLGVEGSGAEINEVSATMSDGFGEISSKDVSSPVGLEKYHASVECRKKGGDGGKNKGEKPIEYINELNEDEREELELLIDNALDQCFFCLYGLNIRSDSSYDDDLATHKNTSRGDYQSKEQCADVFQYILPCARASSKTGLIKLRRVFRAIRKHFPQPPEEVLAGNAIDKFLDDPDLCEDKLSDKAGSEGYLETITKVIFPDSGSVKQHRALMVRSSEPYFEVYCNLYYFLALSEEMSATDKWPGFVLTKEGEEFVQQNANLFKYDLLYNPLRFESWQRLGNTYDEEVDLLLNDGSKHINVAGWRKNVTLPQRVDTSRRRSRRCLLMSLALAKTPAQQCEIHELLALVCYDSLQNVVPFYDQRSAVPSKDAVWMAFCENSLRHFKKAFTQKQDWSHAFYMGKLCEKLGYSYETSLSYYSVAITLNSSAVDPVYRMHASRLKLLCKSGRLNLEVLKVLAEYSFSESTKDAVMNILSTLAPEVSHSEDNIEDRSTREIFERKHESVQLEEVWQMLYNDCISALEVCVEGDLKHFHKARYMLAQGLYKRGLIGDLERAKDELSFCFKSSRSSFTINMWEIDGMVKKGRRKTPGFSGNKKALEVNLPESSRKFITCIRKYLLFYLKLLEETGDICTLDRAFISLRADKRFSLCIEDLVPVALGRFIKTLLLSISQAETADSGVPGNSGQQLEKMFSLFMEQGNLWPEILSLHEIRSPEISESSLYGYLHRYIDSLEGSGKLETLEAMNEKIRKRFKNPKLSNSNCAKVCRHASFAWCRSLIISLALITTVQSGLQSEIHALNSSDSSLESSLLLCIDLQTNELWSRSFEDSTYMGNLETKWNPMLSRIKNVMIKKVSDENLETATSLLRSSYNFYRESSCVMLPSGINLSLVPSRLAVQAQVQPSLDGVEILDLSIPRKLLLWAYALLHGRYANISVVVKHCEENVKSKMKKGAGTSFVPSNASLPAATVIHTAGGRDSATLGSCNEPEVPLVSMPVTSVSLSEGDSSIQCTNPPPTSDEGQKILLATPRLNQDNSTPDGRNFAMNE